MGNIQNRAFCCRDGHTVVIYLAFLLISSLNQDVSVAQGRQIARNPVNVVKGMELISGDRKVMGRSLIGSRPPRCQLKCRKCGQCEAIQVPISPAAGEIHYASDSTPRIEYTRGDDTTNYKPVSWRCKCGDLIFDP